MRERLRLPTGWLSPHYLCRRGTTLGALLVVATVLEVSAAFGMAYVARFSDVAAALTRVSWPWLVGLVAAMVLSFVGYYFAYAESTKSRAAPGWTSGRCGLS